MEEKLFKSKRWNEYQTVEVLNIEAPLTKEDEEEAKLFRKFIDEKIKKEEDAKK